MDIKQNKHTLSLHARFIEGLKKYNLAFEEMANWKYCGGDYASHLKYFQLLYPGKELPDHVDRCVCDHEIVRNGYITDGNQILVLGSCCINRFITHSSRTCELCNKPHKNRNVNLCNTCKVGHCYNCKKSCNPKFKTCYTCNMKDNEVITQCQIDQVKQIPDNELDATSCEIERLSNTIDAILHQESKPLYSQTGYNIHMLDWGIDADVD